MTDVRESTLRGLVARDVLIELGRELDARGIAWVALKGAALHVSACRSPADRPLEDIDVLVSRDQLQDAVLVAKTIGFEPIAESAAAITLFRRSTPLPLDLHHRLFEPGLFRFDADDLLGSAVEQNGLWVPAPLDLYAHLVGHFAKGRLGEKDRVHLEDFARVAAHFRLEPLSVARHLEEHGLSRAARYTLRLCRDVENDVFAGKVIAALRTDKLGDVLAAMARRLLSSRRSPVVGSIAVSVLGESLPRGARSFVLHGAESLRRKCRTWKAQARRRAPRVSGIGQLG